MTSLLRHDKMANARGLFRGTVSTDPSHWFGRTPVHPGLLITGLRSYNLLSSPVSTYPLFIRIVIILVITRFVVLVLVLGP